MISLGDWLPRSVLGRCQALCAYIRMIYVAIYLVFFSGLTFDMLFCDQVSACIPVLKWSGHKVLFYCHFPDMLLTQRATWLKQWYRAPLDWLEEKTTGMADCVLVNSKFTGEDVCISFALRDINNILCCLLLFILFQYCYHVWYVQKTYNSCVIIKV